MAETFLFGAFKGVGDLVAAAPTIRAELDRGNEVALLVFPQLAPAVDLLDFGAGRSRLSVHALPVGTGLGGLWRFLATMARLSPQLIWISPHAPVADSSWKIPLLLAAVKRCLWPRAILAGADTEKFAWLFDRGVAVDRALPRSVREWTGYGRAVDRHGIPPEIGIEQSLRRKPDAELQYDLAICPGATAINRRWPSPLYPALLALLPRQLRLAFIGFPAELDELKPLLPADRRIEFISGTVADAARTIAAARVLLTMDSGLMHLANLMGVPCVALFGPVDPRTVLTDGGSVHPLYKPGLPCQPCERKCCSRAAVDCMAAIEPRIVEHEIMRLLHVPAMQRAIAT